MKGRKCLSIQSDELGIYNFEILELEIIHLRISTSRGPDNILLACHKQISWVTRDGYNIILYYNRTCPDRLTD